MLFSERDIVFISTGSNSKMGFDVLDRQHLDVPPEWTMVSHAEFATDGEVRSFEIFSGAADRRLRVGIYRPTVSGNCQFQLIQQKEWPGFPVGVTKVRKLILLILLLLYLNANQLYDRIYKWTKI